MDLAKPWWNPFSTARLALWTAILVVTGFGGLRLAVAQEADEAAAGVREELETLRESFDLPGMAAVAFRWNELLALEAVGVRWRGHPEPFSPEDKVHLGSITKSMTATLAAILIEDPSVELEWESTIGDIWGERGWRRLTGRSR